MFVGDGHVLLGIHSHPKNAKENVSGFGGKAEQGECPLQTAFRETIEELFDIQAVPSALIELLIDRVVPNTIMFSNELCQYYTHVFSLNDLKRILEISRPFIEPMQVVYDEFPLTVWDLITGREHTTRESEISHILLWPLSYAATSVTLCKEVFDDITTMFTITSDSDESNCMIVDDAD
jgi:hypothetical protein